MIAMPRNIREILDHADELARRFEDYEPDAADERDPRRSPVGCTGRETVLIAHRLEA